MAKTINLPTTNLILVSSGLDKNGNKIVKLRFDPYTSGFSSHPRGFSIQTNGNLPKTGSILRGKKTPTDMLEIGATDLITIGKEVTAYLKEHGSTSQKKAIR